MYVNMCVQLHNWYLHIFPYLLRRMELKLIMEERILNKKNNAKIYSVL